MSEHPFQGRVAVVTGSTSGIGLGIARMLADRGAHVMLNGFGKSDQIESLRQELEALGPGRVGYHDADMRHPEAIADLLARTVEQLGPVDTLVNNAGIQHVAPVHEFPLDRWDDILAINLSSAFHTIRGALPGMLEAGFGRIVNVASAHALVASPFKSAYVAAKHGIAGLTKTVALETADRGITVNAICPGYVKTPLVEGQVADTARARGISEEEVVRDVMLLAQPTRQFVTIEQVAELAMYLCRKECASITGSMLSIDGGWTAK